MTQHGDNQGPAMLDALIGTITVDAHRDDEKLCAFRRRSKTASQSPATPS